jgi:hypothetical protein
MATRSGPRCGRVARALRRGIVSTIRARHVLEDSTVNLDVAPSAGQRRPGNGKDRCDATTSVLQERSIALRQYLRLKAVPLDERVDKRDEGADYRTHRRAQGSRHVSLRHFVRNT